MFQSHLRPNLKFFEYVTIELVDYHNIMDLCKFLTFEEPFFTYFHPHAFDIASVLKEIDTGDYYCLMYWCSSPCGYGMLRGYNAGYKIPALGIAIGQSFNGKGLGRYLMSHLELVAQLNGADRIRLTVAKENPRAIDLYTKCGYTLNDYNEYDLVGYKTFPKKGETIPEGIDKTITEEDIKHGYRV